MSTDIRKEFEEFIEVEMPDLFADDKKKELQECWLAYLRGYNLALGFEIDRLKAKLALQDKQSALINLWFSVAISIGCVIVIVLLIMGGKT